MTQDSKSLPTLVPRIAAAVAFLAAGTVFLGAIGGQIAMLLFVVPPLLAGIGILRYRAWSAYGFAFFEVAQLLLLSLILLRPGHGDVQGRAAAVIAAITALLITLFWFAGRSLAKTGHVKGRAWPWVVLSALYTLPFCFVQTFVIPTGSMEDTLLLGDRIVVQTFPRPNPQRGDLITFRFPFDRRQTSIKRVIGMAGDRIHFSAKQVYRNGSLLSEPYAVHKFPMEDYRDNFPTGAVRIPLDPGAQDMLARHVVHGDVVVPAGKYFVLGDNRDNSLDSRYWGFLDGSDIFGRPRLIYDSQAPATENSPDVKRLGLERTRWRRLIL